MQPEDKIRLQHILDEANEVRKYTQDISFKEFVTEGKTVRAVVRSIEVIGEAASKISIDFRKEHPEIPWEKVIGMRNRLIHVYFDIDYKIVWKTLQENLPSLVNQLKTILKST